MDAPIIERLKNTGYLDRIFIDGQWRMPAGLARSAVINPATEQPIAQIALGNAQDVAAAVAAAKQALQSWSATSSQIRAVLLDRVHRMILDRAEQLAQAISLEMGAAITFARGTQIPIAAEHIRMARELARRRPLLGDREGMTMLREPVGVCGLVTPWNWSLHQITGEVGRALAAGRAVVLIPGKGAPLSAVLFAEIISDAGIPPGVFNLVHGDELEVRAALALHTDVDMVPITGSSRADVLAAETAATAEQAAQELDGKLPYLMLPDVDFARVVHQGVAAVFRHLGQSVSAPARMLVPRLRMAEVERLARDAAAALVVGDPRLPETTHGPVASLVQFNRVQELLDAGVEAGARLVCGGPGRPHGLERGFYVRPTVLADVHPQMRIAKEEIFGPVLVIIPYDTMHEATEVTDGTAERLSTQVQGSDIDATRGVTARGVTARIRSGAVHVKHPAWSPHARLGSGRRAGNSRDSGVEGLPERLETKTHLVYMNEELA